MTVKRLNDFLYELSLTSGLIVTGTAFQLHDRFGNGDLFTQLIKLKIGETVTLAERTK